MKIVKIILTSFLSNVTIIINKITFIKRVSYKSFKISINSPIFLALKWTWHTNYFLKIVHVISLMIFFRHFNDFFLCWISRLDILMFYGNPLGQSEPTRNPEWSDLKLTWSETDPTRKWPDRNWSDPKPDRPTVFPGLHVSKLQSTKGSHLFGLSIVCHLSILLKLLVFIIKIWMNYHF